MEIYAIGTRVNFEGIRATITAASIRQSSVLYEVSYMATGGDHKLTWVYDFEFTVEEDIKIKVGFKS